MVEIGYRPILWHVMKYYAHFGHTEFILCLGYKADLIKNYFLNYNEALSNDFVALGRRHEIELLRAATSTTGASPSSTPASRQHRPAARGRAPYLEDEEMFLANYSDGLTDLDLPASSTHFRSTDRVRRFLAVRPPHTYHVVDGDAADGSRRSSPSASPTCGSTPASSCSSRRSSTTCTPGEELVLRAVRSG